MAEDSATTMAQETENVSSVDVTKPSEPEASGVNTLATSDHKHQPVKTAQPSQQEDIEGLYSTLTASVMDSAAMLQRSAVATFSTTNVSFNPQDTRSSTQTSSRNSGMRERANNTHSTTKLSATYDPSSTKGRSAATSKFSKFVARTRRMRKDLKESIPTVGFTNQMHASTEDPSKAWNRRVGKTDSIRPTEISGIYSTPETRYLPTPQVSPYTEYPSKTVYVARQKTQSDTLPRQDYTSQKPQSQAPDRHNYQSVLPQVPQQWLSPIIYQPPVPPPQQYVNYPSSTIVNPPSVNVNPPPVHVHINNSGHQQEQSSKTDDYSHFFQQQVYEMKQAIDQLRHNLEDFHQKSLEDNRPPPREGPSDDAILSMITSLALQEYRPERPQPQPVTVNVQYPEQKQAESKDDDKFAEKAIETLQNISSQFARNQDQWANILSARFEREDRLFDEFRTLRQAMEKVNQPQESSIPYEQILEQINTVVDKFSSTLSDAYSGHLGSLSEQFNKIREDLLELVRENESQPEPEPSRQVTVTRCKAVQDSVEPPPIVPASAPVPTLSKEESISTTSTSEESGMDIATYLNLLRKSHERLYGADDELLVDDDSESSGDRSTQRIPVTSPEIGIRPRRDDLSESDSLSTSTFPLSTGGESDE